MGTIETRELYKDGELTIVGHMVLDDGDPNFPDFGDSPEDIAAKDEFMRHFERDDFVYVGMAVHVFYAGAEIGSDSLWGTEHGQINDSTYADAWQNTPAEYPAPNTVRGGSSLNSVIDEAIGNAIEWAGKHGNPAMRAALATAEKWVDPNVRPEVKP